MRAHSCYASPLSTACKHGELGGRSAATIDAIDLKGAVDSCTPILARFRQRHEDAAERGLRRGLCAHTALRARYLSIAHARQSTNL